MNIHRALTLSAVVFACVLGLSACKNNQPQQQSAGLPSSGGGTPSSGSSGSSGPSAPSPSGGRSGSRGGPSMPSGSSGSPGSGLPSGGLPGGGLPGGGLPGGGLPGSSPAGGPGSGFPGAGDPGGDSDGQGRPGSPGAESPFPGGDSDGDGIPDTAQSGFPGDDVDFSESTGGAVSREEQVAVLDAELDGSMRDYDGRILEERAGVMDRANETGANQQLEDFDRSVAYYDEAEEGELSEEVSTAEPPAAPQSGNEPGLPTNGRSNDIVTPPPEDIPSGDDDDVVARQIREAAMKETDPDLREALWEEYRKYKNQTKR